MQFETTTTEIKKRLEVAFKAVNPNPVVPILENVLLNVTPGTMCLTTSDLEVTTKQEMVVVSMDTFNTTVPAKQLYETISSLPEQPLKFVFNDLELTLISSNGKYKMACADAADFPTQSTMENPLETEMSLVALHQVVSEVVFATTTDELRPAMMGVLFEVDKDGDVNFVATDAHKLAKFTARGIAQTGIDEKKGTGIIPTKFWKLIVKLFPPSDDQKVTMRWTRKSVQLTSDTTEISALLINANYPYYQNVIPRVHQHEITINKQDLVSSLKRILIYANRVTHQVFFQFLNDGKDVVHVTSLDMDYSQEAREQLTYTGTSDKMGDDYKISFNARFLLSVLQAIKTENVVLRLNKPNQAATIIPEDEDTAVEEHLYLVMPVVIY
jgi:DNA polymerase-3 subunit beta